MPLLIDLEPLAKRLDKDPSSVLVLVGTGVSAGATGAAHASWLGLLEHAIQYLETSIFRESHARTLSRSLHDAFSPFKLDRVLQFAEQVENLLSVPDETALSAWLDSAFGTLKALPERSQTLDALRDLYEAGVLLATTNYDSLLSEATGAPPVTWQEPEFLQVMNRERSGILHLHGHWRKPGSIVLGKSSYDRVVRDELFQPAFKSLWMTRSWLYVGYGDGLDDPNLGSLLEWGRAWKTGSLKHYFLARADKAEALARRPDKPSNLVSVAYSNHDKLPGDLRSLLPIARCHPFISVDEDFYLFRSPGSGVTVPFPSRAEYLASEVPAVSCDADILTRLEHCGWAFVLDVASVGKTTLALRMATSPEHRENPVYYLDLAREFDSADMSGVIRRLSRTKCLLIVDNVHHQPELARQMWDEWRLVPHGSKFLLIATRIERTVTTAPAQDLGFFEHHPINPAMELRPTAEDLANIVKHLYRRVAGRAKPLAAPPTSVLQAWQRDYGSALGAFCVAVLARFHEFQRSRWELPLEAASDWVREKWLKHLDHENLQNALCLAVFGAQELELEVQGEALPYPGRTHQLFKLGLVSLRGYGSLSQYERLSFREPGWGRLVLAARVPQVDEEEILFETAARHPYQALVLNSRLRLAKSLELLAGLWRYLAKHSGKLIQLISKTRLDYAANLIIAAKNTRQIRLAECLWDALEHQPEKFAAQAWETPLDKVGSFLETAKRQSRETTPLWEALEREPEKFAAQAWETPLDKVGSFFETAKRQGRETTRLWEALEREPEKLAARAWETPLSDVGSFFETAKRQGRETMPLWEALEHEPEKLAARAWETSLSDVGSFFETAKRQGRETTPLWEALEREPEKLAARAWETSLNKVGSFFETAKRQGRETTRLWEALEREPEKLAARAWETPLGDVGSFLETAKRQSRKTTPLWEALEREPEKLATRAWETSLEHVGGFLSVAKEQGRDASPLWEALEHEPARLSAIGKKARANELAAFCRQAPDALIRIVLADIEATHWNAIPFSEPFTGATWVASACGRAGREDLKSAILTKLLRRANPQDFPPQVGSFANVAWMLENVPAGGKIFLSAFLDSVCTSRWLGGQYTTASCGRLADGLGLLALHQAKSMLLRFQNRSLSIRLQKVISHFVDASGQGQVDIIRLLGSAALCGWLGKSEWLNGLPLDVVGRLAAEVIPHRPDAEKIERWQFQFWLGLRAVASSRKKSLDVSPDLILQTLKLWRTNLAESSMDPASAEHQVNLNMVAWLEKCSQENNGLLPN